LEDQDGEQESRAQKDDSDEQFHDYPPEPLIQPADKRAETVPKSPLYSQMMQVSDSVQFSAADERRLRAVEIQKRYLKG
jgi:hypothetical protein